MKKMVQLLEFNSLVYKYSHRGIFVDTEPLLVYIVGRCKPSELKNIGQYNEKDYEIVSSFLKLVSNSSIT